MPSGPRCRPSLTLLARPTLLRLRPASRTLDLILQVPLGVVAVVQHPLPAAAPRPPLNVAIADEPLSAMSPLWFLGAVSPHRVRGVQTTSRLGPHRSAARLLEHRRLPAASWYHVRVSPRTPVVTSAGCRQPPRVATTVSGAAAVHITASPSLSSSTAFGAVLAASAGLCASGTAVVRPGGVEGTALTVYQSQCGRILWV